jgi:hypothetical protein
MSNFPLPNYTQVPNYIIDEWMSKLSHAEFKFIMLIVRYTCGFHRREAKISYAHFEKKCGIDKRTAIRISKKFEKMEWIKVSRENEYTANTFEILLAPEEDSKKDKGVTSDHGGGDMRPPGGVTSDHPNKEKEETKKENHYPQAVVVPSNLEALKIRDSLKQKITREHSDKIDILVKRVQAWENRQDDNAAALHILANWDKWIDTQSKQDLEAANLEILHHLKKYEGLEVISDMYDVKIEVGRKDVTFKMLTFAEVANIDDKNFKEKINSLLAKYKVKKLSDL